MWYRNGPQDDVLGTVFPGSGGRLRTYDLWVMSHPRAVSPVPTGCNLAGQYDRWLLSYPVLSQQTHSVARRLVTIAVTKHGSYSPSLR